MVLLEAFSEAKQHSHVGAYLQADVKQMRMFFSNVDCRLVSEVINDSKVSLINALTRTATRPTTPTHM